MAGFFDSELAGAQSLSSSEADQGLLRPWLEKCDADSRSHWTDTMYRCASIAALAALLCAPLAQAQVMQATRFFPKDALRGELQITQPPEALLNGQAARLAPGSRIRGTNNMLVLSGAVVGQKFSVNYTLDPTGLVMDVWVLTEAEQKASPWPRTPQEAAAWRFDPSTQTWAKP